LIPSLFSYLFIKSVTSPGCAATLAHNLLGGGRLDNDDHSIHRLQQRPQIRIVGVKIMSEHQATLTLNIILSSDTIPTNELRQALFSTEEGLAAAISEYLAKALPPLLKGKPGEDFAIVIEQDW
jgi:hypothetical protein